MWNAAALWTALAALGLCPAEAVKVGVQPVSVGSHVFAGLEEASVTQSRAPPDIEEFRKRFAAMPADPGLNFTKTAAMGELKLLVGMLSIGRELDYREVHRKTWMSNPDLKVCKIGSDTKSLPSGCNIFATFVLGSDGKTDSKVAEESRKFGDITLATTDSGVPVKDADTGNSNTWGIKIKVFHLFRHAIENWPGLTHVLKTDMDTYPYVGQVAHVLVAASSQNKDAELSQAMFTKNGYTPPGSWMESDGVRLGNQGQFYGYSANTLSCVYKTLRERYSVNGKLPDPGDEPGLPMQGTPGEDGFFTEMVQHMCTPGSGPCKPAWNLKTWDGHLKQPWLQLWVDVVRQSR
eukprot:gb/GFBE01050936.1/.p1 GENE.gb/GFBE01050936.1/~~gb/GFBE01050936.1/.p1  ORF type:complete len:349 (+),score=62.11 gb/GFBE01050936.1/:3-1049(+)